MGESYEIVNLMVKDHEDIIYCLKDLQKNIENSELIGELFDKFKWEFEKHIFVEEKAIFTFFNPDNNEDYKEIPYILDEHNVLLGLLNKLEKDIMSKDKIDISKFKKLLEQHKNFEESSLYPKLDRNLDRSQKDIIIKRIREITCRE